VQIITSTLKSFCHDTWWRKNNEMVAYKLNQWRGEGGAMWCGAVLAGGR